ncbi:glycosyltransferase [Rhodococcus kroppenstedtii]|uniref:glycosyltransferase n=1 Tax=Rhodococcoides kroppenstedtii TaxID=293050 RepID=UPI001C9AF079|nr:glycosyltransferase [Rhodococcus kroppenstedtii]MBY6437545.1 glycosyltransferase [Rhodococcus kroppenstedtii]
MDRTVCIIGTRGYPSYYGGFETLVRHLAPYLVDEGWRVVVYGRPHDVDRLDPYRDRRVESVMTAGVDRKSLSTITYGFSSSLHSALSVRPDVALVMNVANGFWLPVLRARGIPTLVNVDGVEWEREKWGTVARRVFRAGATATARYATELIYDSEALAERWSVMSGRVGTYIPYGGVFRTRGTVPLGLTSGGYVLMVARFVPENTIEPFLDAAAVLSRDWPVVVVGSSGYGGPLEARVAQLARDHANITWVGHVHDDNVLFGLWEHAGAYFHGHSVGGTNPALVQAMACGSPVVARDTPYNREVLGDTAIFVNPDPSSIAEGLDVLMRDERLRQCLGSSARTRAETSFTWPGVCAAYSTALSNGVLGTTRAQNRV